ncbi:MAG: prephenate dehydrogenase [Thermococcus sp.]|nr:prephenate dehydrogenase [Thermococcus sp.]
MRFGIVGYGRMGRLFGRCLKGEVKFYSRHREMDFESLGELYEWADVIVIATSLDAVPETLKELSTIASKRPRDVVIFDIATFKREIVGLYGEFPPEVRVASVHPMFGEGVKSFEGQLFIVVPVGGREGDAEWVAGFLRSLGGRVEVMDAEEHDRIVGLVVGVPYLIGLKYLEISAEMDLDRFGGTSHRFLTTYGKAVLNDSPEFIAEVLERSREEIEEFIRALGKMPNLDGLLGQISENEIKEAYRRLYRVLEP